MTIALWIGGLLALGGLLKLQGWLWDLAAEQAAHPLQPPYADGVYPEASPRQHVTHQEMAVVFVHGFTDTPLIFDEIIARLDWQKADWFAPLLPFHGRGLAEMVDFDPYIIEAYLRDYLERKLAEYQQVILVGQSLGGAATIRLAQSHPWPRGRLRWIWCAPAVFVNGNTRVYRWLYRIYPWWRSYLKTAGTPSADESARLRLMQVHRPHFYIVPAIARLQAYCLKAETALRQLRVPHTIIIARNDNRIQAQNLLEVCQESPHCRLVVFDEGKHLLYWSRQVPALVEVIRAEMLTP